MTENLENVSREALMKSTQQQNPNTKKIWEWSNLDYLKSINNFVLKPKLMALEGLPYMELGKKQLFVQTSWMLSSHRTFTQAHPSAQCGLPGPLFLPLWGYAEL